MKVKTDVLLIWVLIVLLFLMIYFPCLVWMKERFLQEGSYYSHGFLVPFVSVYFAFRKLKSIKGKKCQFSASKSGLIIIIFALVINFLANLTSIHFPMGVSMILFLAGVIVFLYGFNMLRLLAFPLAFLFFMVPLPAVILTRVAFFLKILAIKLARWQASLIGIETYQMGSYVFLPNREFLLIGYPCSGLRSIISLLSLSFIFTQFLNKGFCKKLALIMASIPIAIFTNSLRIALLIIFSSIYGLEFATGRFHDYTGIAVFGLALGIFIYLKNLLI